MVEQEQVAGLMVKMPQAVVVLVVAVEIEERHQMALLIKDIMGGLGMTVARPQPVVAGVLAEMA